MQPFPSLSPSFSHSYRSRSDWQAAMTGGFQQRRLCVGGPSHRDSRWRLKPDRQNEKYRHLDGTPSVLSCLSNQEGNSRRLSVRNISVSETLTLRDAAALEKKQYPHDGGLTRTLSWWDGFFSDAKQITCGCISSHTTHWDADVGRTFGKNPTQSDWMEPSGDGLCQTWEPFFPFF